MSIRCPRCTETTKGTPYRGAPGHAARPTLLRSAHEAGVELDSCAGCGGVWLDHGELERIQSAARKRGGGDSGAAVHALTTRSYQRGRRDQQPPTTCPSCGDSMVEREWSIATLIFVDVCVGCRGVWIQDDQLDALELYFQAM